MDSIEPVSAKGHYSSMPSSPRFWNPEGLDYTKCPLMHALIASRPTWRRHPDCFPSGQDWLEDHEARLAVAKRHGVLDSYLKRLVKCTVRHRLSCFSELASVRFLEERVGMKISRLQEGKAEIEFELEVDGTQVLTEVKAPGWQAQFVEDWRAEQNHKRGLPADHRFEPTKAQVRRLKHPHKFLKVDGVRMFLRPRHWRSGRDNPLTL